MKKFLNIVVATFVASISTSCMINNQSISNGGGNGGGKRLVRPASPTTKSASEAFGNQPVRPTGDVTHSTWGATMGSSHWWNDMRNGRAKLQACSANEPVLVARASGFVWREGCENRVVPADAPTEAVYETVASSGDGNIYGPNFKVTVFERPSFTFISNGNSSGYGGYNSYQPRYQNNYRPRHQQRQHCPPNHYRSTSQSNSCPPGHYRPNGR